MFSSGLDVGCSRLRYVVAIEVLGLYRPCLELPARRNVREPALHFTRGFLVVWGL